jgi:hypothetical protein
MPTTSRPPGLQGVCNPLWLGPACGGWMLWVVVGGFGAHVYRHCSREQVAKAATEVTVHTAVLGIKVTFSLARGCRVAVEGAVLTLPA